MSYRNWCFTLNNYAPIDVMTLLLSPTEEHRVSMPVVTYIGFGEEVGANGTPHLQGYIELKTKSRMAALKKIQGLAKAHFEPRRGTQAQAVEYCKKDGKYSHAGQLKEAPLESVIDWNKVWENAVEGKWDEIPPKIKITQYSTLKRIEADYAVIHKDLDWVKPPNQWLYGPTGTGKSRTARLENPGFYYKMKNKWWDGYKGEGPVLIDDLDHDHAKWIGGFLKEWADRYGFRSEVKGLSTVLRPKKIIVTSNYSIRELFPDPSMYEPLERRFKVRFFSAVMGPLNEYLVTPDHETAHALLNRWESTQAEKDDPYYDECASPDAQVIKL